MSGMLAGLAAPAGSQEPQGRSLRRQEDGAGRREGEDEKGNTMERKSMGAHHPPVLVYITGDRLLLAAVPRPAELVACFLENANPAALY